MKNLFGIVTLLLGVFAAFYGFNIISSSDADGDVKVIGWLFFIVGIIVTVTGFKVMKS